MPRIKINWWLVGILLGILLLRIPSWFEPNWYGDEGIYLALGQAINRGGVLYRDIWDNKPPLLYLLYAIQPTLLWAKLSATVFVLATCGLVYVLAKKIFSDQKNDAVYSLMAVGISGIFLSIPFFEGTIANAELYFTLPIVLGALLVWKMVSGGFRTVTASWVGLLAAIAFLFKVPAVFDFGGLILAYLIIDLEKGFVWSRLGIIRTVRKKINILMPIGVVFVIPLAITGIYFYLNHGLSDFIIAAFSQNASYVAIDSGPLSKLSNPLFVKAIVLLFGSALLMLGYWKKRVSKELLFLSLWFGFALYGALLSNRPYMHYLLQIVVPTTLLMGYVLVNVKKYFWVLAALILIGVYLWRSFTGAFNLDTAAYYRNFWNYISERESWDDYAANFDPRTLTIYQVADFIRQNTLPNDPIFVWADASYIYVLANRPPVTKFIAAHHLSTIDPVNYNLVMDRLNRFQPKYILVSRPVGFQFPNLEVLLAKNYRLVNMFNDIYVYKNMAHTSPQPWSIQYP